MAKAPSGDLRERVVAVIDGAVAAPGCSSVRGQRIEGDPVAPAGAADRTGDAPAARRQPTIKSDRGAADVILAAVAKQPDITLAELREWLAGRGVSVGIATLWRFFARRNITHKSPGMLRSRIVPRS